MKKISFILIVMLLIGGTLSSTAASIELKGGRINPTGSTTGHSKSPIPSWCVDLDDYVITMDATPCDYTLNLYDENDEVVYSVFVPAGSTMIVLPSTLSGSFEIRFETDTYYYYGYIEL